MSKGSIEEQQRQEIEMLNTWLDLSKAKCKKFKVYGYIAFVLGHLTGLYGYFMFFH